MESHTVLGHPIGMLDRDQRTTKCSFYHIVKRANESHPGFSQTKSNERCSGITHVRLPRRTSPRVSCRIKKNRHFWVSLQRLRRTLELGFYLSVLIFPTTFSAPSRRSTMSNNQQGVKREERWKMPCGSEINTVAHGEQAVPDAVLLSRIISQADRALAKANDFKERFVQNTFYYTTFEKFHSSFKPEFFHLDWLQSREKIPKELGESVPKEHLATLKIEETLYNTYEHLQKVAIGFEQMIEDGQNGIGDRFIAEFNETLDYVLSILCEIQTAMVERNMELRSDVERDVMPNDLKGLDTTATNNRNWIIYRDYMNLLEYVIESFRYLKQKH